MTLSGDGLAGKSAVVTGASRGIGRACARALSERGVQVVLVARSEEDLHDVASELPTESHVLAVDLSRPDGPTDAAERALASTGNVDILVNNAGIVLNRRTENLTVGQVDGVIAVNLRAPLLLAGSLAPSMRDTGGGSIVNVSSINGIAGLPFSGVYGATKGAIDAFTRSVAAEWGPFGIRVNSVAPGVIVTDMWERGRSEPGVIERVRRQIALRRWGAADEIADVVVFLASERSRYVTGQTLAVDGGLSNLMDLLPRSDEPQEPETDVAREEC